MNPLYLQLGRGIAGLCPPGFQSAALTAKMVEGEPPELGLLCTTGEGDETFPPIGEEDRDALAETLNAVRDAQAAEDGKTWRTCTVTLKAGGGFEMDVGG